ncbi:hypothetical protein BKA81DRAFT_296906, partial [Phyllosticta paracitricarpa]
QLFSIAATNGWKRCYHCRRMVQLVLGCNHVSCLCGAEFCFHCGCRWRTCGCEYFHESTLLSSNGQNHEG